MPFTPVDWTIIAIIAISALISLKRGFVKEALSLLIWIVAGAVAWMFGGSLAQYLVAYIDTPSARVIAGCTILFVATLLVGAMVNFLIGELIRVTGLGGTDRFLGMVFGAARGGLLVVVAVGLLSLGPVQQDQWWQQSKLMPQFLMVADWSKNLILGFSSKWLASGISVPADLPFKDHLLPQNLPQDVKDHLLSQKLPQDVFGKSSSTK
ncbi:CvpA family protein [Pseudomonas sp. NA-150]|uniref:CvpA family protein n=1 Tax=Pseudomonas sp. NA-150 TaxID=3367525 RepID=UPI0037C58A5C